ncbi:hypothetical protein [Burkholderia dolosa]|jgi:hypothetical protein|uniref:hypothetical protein n=1 Tax=Burkholderia dolosa TaxID=152500 RepID=UPI0027D2288D|nr:hypothetical protein [Burkholderia dolosa]
MNGWIGRRATARSIIAVDGAPGKPFSGKLRVLERGDAQDNAHKPVMLPGHDTFVEGAMDLAMAMGIALFGMFTGSTVLFFYQLGR